MLIGRGRVLLRLCLLTKQQKKVYGYNNDYTIILCVCSAHTILLFYNNNDV